MKKFIVLVEIIVLIGCGGGSSSSDQNILIVPDEFVGEWQVNHLNGSPVNSIWLVFTHRGMTLIIEDYWLDEQGACRIANKITSSDVSEEGRLFHATIVRSSSGCFALPGDQVDFYGAVLRNKLTLDWPNGDNYIIAYRSYQ